MEILLKLLICYEFWPQMNLFIKKRAYIGLLKILFELLAFLFCKSVQKTAKGFDLVVVIQSISPRTSIQVRNALIFSSRVISGCSLVLPPRHHLRERWQGSDLQILGGLQIRCLSAYTPQLTSVWQTVLKVVHSEFVQRLHYHSPEHHLYRFLECYRRADPYGTSSFFMARGVWDA